MCVGLEKVGVVGGGEGGYDEEEVVLDCLEGLGLLVIVVVVVVIVIVLIVVVIVVLIIVVCDIIIIMILAVFAVVIVVVVIVERLMMMMHSCISINTLPINGSSSRKFFLCTRNSSSDSISGRIIVDVVVDIGNAAPIHNALIQNSFKCHIPEQ